jgi:hypothetical protein
MNTVAYVCTLRLINPRTPDQDSFPGSPSCKVSLGTTMSYLLESRFMIRTKNVGIIYHWYSLRKIQVVSQRFKYFVFH